jgi:hypothetical protein
MNAYDTAQARHIALTAVRMQPFVRQLAAITGFGALLVKS